MWVEEEKYVQRGLTLLAECVERGGKESLCCCVSLHQFLVCGVFSLTVIISLILKEGIDSPILQKKSW